MTGRASGSAMARLSLPLPIFQGSPGPRRLRLDGGMSNARKKAYALALAAHGMGLRGLGLFGRDGGSGNDEEERENF